MLPALRHHEIELPAENGEHAFDARLTECGDSPHVRASDANGAGAEGDRFEDVGSTAEAAIDQHRNTVPYNLNDFRQTVDRRSPALCGTSAVIGNDDPVS